MNQPVDLSNDGKRKMTRRAPTVREATPQERQQHEDMSWALQDPEVQLKYRGQYVVPYQRRIVAHGTDVTLVREEAMRATGKKAEQLPVVPIVDLLQEISPE